MPRYHCLTVLLLTWIVSSPAIVNGQEEPSPHAGLRRLIGYTEGRNDITEGQFANWVTNRACVVRADGTKPQVLAEELTKTPHSWTQFAGWSPDGKLAVIGSHWESPENAAWEREHKTFRMTEGWLSDICLLDLDTGKIVNVRPLTGSAPTTRACSSCPTVRVTASRH